MTNDLAIVSMAQELAAHASTRQGLISENVANADTIGFRARDLTPFAEIYEDERSGATMAETPAFHSAATRAGHPGFDAATGAAEAPAFASRAVAGVGADSPNGNNVSLEDQMVRGAEAKAHHDLALGVLRKSLDLIRMGIGRA